jgi:hypothetical protein
MPWVEVSEMTQSPFEIEVIRQQEGDLVLLPADSYYQTFTLRGRAVKAWWHRVVPHTVRASLQSLHVMHKFCRPEKYRYVPRNALIDTCQTRCTDLAAASRLLPFLDSTHARSGY